MVAAKASNVPALNDIDQALKIETDFLQEDTGSTRLAEIVASKLDNACGKPITHQMAFVKLSEINDNYNQVRHTVISVIGKIKKVIDHELNSVRHPC